MALLIFTIVVAAAIAVYLTSLVCRRSVARGHRPSFWPAAVASLGSPVVIILASQGSDLFSRRFWQEEVTGEALPWQLLFVFICFVVNIGPTLGVVVYYRKPVKGLR